MKGIMKSALAAGMAVVMLVTCGFTESRSARLRLFAFGAVYSAATGTGYTSLSGIATADHPVYAAFLRDGWGVTGRESAIRRLDWLKKEGDVRFHDGDTYTCQELYGIASGKLSADTKTLDYLYDQLVAFDNAYNTLVRRYGYDSRELDEIVSIEAWYYDQMVTVARWCYGLGYITEDEMWEYLVAASQKAFDLYDDWRDYCAAALMGYNVWSAYAFDFMEMNQAGIDSLIRNQNSIYRTVPFRNADVPGVVIWGDEVF